MVNDGTVELIIRGEGGEKLDTFKWNFKDKELEKKLFLIIRNKYGVFRREEKKDQDIDWLKRV